MSDEGRTSHAAAEVLLSTARLSSFPKDRRESAEFQFPETGQTQTIRLYSHDQTKTFSRAEEEFKVEDLQLAHGEHGPLLFRTGECLDPSILVLSIDQSVDRDRLSLRPGMHIFIGDCTLVIERFSGLPHFNGVSCDRRDSPPPLQQSARFRDAGDSRLSRPDGSFAPTRSILKSSRGRRRSCSEGDHVTEAKSHVSATLHKVISWGDVRAADSDELLFDVGRQSNDAYRERLQTWGDVGVEKRAYRRWVTRSSSSSSDVDGATSPLTSSPPPPAGLICGINDCGQGSRSPALGTVAEISVHQNGRVRHVRVSSDVRSRLTVGCAEGNVVKTRFCLADTAAVVLHAGSLGFQLVSRRTPFHTRKKRFARTRASQTGAAAGRSVDYPTCCDGTARSMAEVSFPKDDAAEPRNAPRLDPIYVQVPLEPVAAKKPVKDGNKRSGENSLAKASAESFCVGHHDVLWLLAPCFSFDASKRSPNAPTALAAAIEAAAADVRIRHCGEGDYQADAMRRRRRRRWRAGDTNDLEGEAMGRSSGDEDASNQTLRIRTHQASPTTDLTRGRSPPLARDGCSLALVSCGFEIMTRCWLDEWGGSAGGGLSPELTYLYPPQPMTKLAVEVTPRLRIKWSGLSDRRVGDTRCFALDVRSRSKFTFGKDPRNADVAIDGDSASLAKRHARIHWSRQDGIAWIERRSTSKATYLMAGCGPELSRPRVLFDGVAFRVGSSEFRVHLDPRAEERQARDEQARLTRQRSASPPAPSWQRTTTAAATKESKNNLLSAEILASEETLPMLPLSSTTNAGGFSTGRFQVASARNTVPSCVTPLVHPDGCNRARLRANSEGLAMRIFQQRDSARNLSESMVPPLRPLQRATGDFLPLTSIPGITTTTNQHSVNWIKGPEDSEGFALPWKNNPLTTRPSFGQNEKAEESGNENGDQRSALGILTSSRKKHRGQEGKGDGTIPQVNQNGADFSPYVVPRNFEDLRDHFALPTTAGAFDDRGEEVYMILECLRGPLSGKFFKVMPHSAVIGSDMYASDIVVNDRLASSVHCRLLYSEQRWCLQDLQSERGTWIRLGRDNNPTIEPGSCVKMGNTHLRFRAAVAGEISRPSGACCSLS